MPEPILDHAGWIALGSAVAAALVASVLAWRAWQQWRRVRVVQRAASALVGMHLDRLDDAIEIAGRRAGTMADGGEELAESLAELRADALHLKWLVSRVPDERDRLRRAIGDLVLPTDPRRRTEATDGP